MGYFKKEPYSITHFLHQVVYVTRNPKDVIVSYYHHHNKLIKHHGYKGTLEHFAQYFMDDECKFRYTIPN